MICLIDMPIKKTKIQRPWVKEREAFGRRKDNTKFYNARQWRKVSKLFRNENSFCKHCDADGKVGPADVCDHIKGLDFLLSNGIDPYDFNELQSLCHRHHNIKSGKESHGYIEGIPPKNTKKK